MQHKKLHLLAIAVVVLITGYGGWFVYSNTLGRPLLEGETTHEFGVVLLEGPITEVTHVFELVNNTDEIIHIKDLKSTCKCTTPALEDRQILPGKTMTLTATLEVRDSGLQKAGINLLLGDDRVQTLFVSAVGRRKNPLNYQGRYIELRMGLPSNLPIECETYDGKTEPPPLRVRTPEGVSATFKRWKLTELYEPEWQDPAVWEAELIVTRNKLELSPDDTVDVSLDGETWYSVPINRPDLVELIEATDVKEAQRH